MRSFELSYSVGIPFKKPLKRTKYTIRKESGNKVSLILRTNKNKHINQLTVSVIWDFRYLFTRYKIKSVVI